MGSLTIFLTKIAAESIGPPIPDGRAVLPFQRTDRERGGGILARELSAIDKAFSRADAREVRRGPCRSAPRALQVILNVFPARRKPDGMRGGTG